MREIYLLETKDACHKFLLNRTANGFLPDTFLGIGSFSSKISQSGVGLTIQSSPKFFVKEISESIIQGHFSVFEKESLLMQVPFGEVGNFPIARWLLVGKHLSIFDSDKIDAVKYLPTKELMQVRTVEEFMQVYLSFIFPHIHEIRAQSVLFLFDINIYISYIKQFFNWLSKQISNPLLFKNIIEISTIDFQRKITDEFLWFISESSLHPCIAIFPSTKSSFTSFIQSARNIKKQNGYSDELFFKL
nr:hypothetical protein GTC16762_01300 [Pigmentibacter ruber]